MFDIKHIHKIDEKDKELIEKLVTEISKFNSFLELFKEGIVIKPHKPKEKKP